MPFPIEEKYIIECEDALGARFPQSYRQSMMLSNGGEIELDCDCVWFLYPIFNKKNNKMISRTASHLLLEVKGNLDWREFPENGVGIAGDGGGNQLVFLKGEDGNMAPEVYDWDHETARLTKIADDFEELLVD